MYSVRPPVERLAGGVQRAVEAPVPPIRVREGGYFNFKKAFDSVDWQSLRDFFADAEFLQGLSH